MKKVVSLLMAVLMLSICLISCGSKNELLGTWSYSVSDEDLGMELEMSFTFEDDGKASISIMGTSVNATYEVNGDEITIKPENSEMLGTDEPLQAKFSIDGDTLKLEETDSGEVLELTKSK